MGALHAGHVALLRAARAENDVLAASIFVNPLQFERPSDLNSYPRTMEADLAVCKECGVDVVFAPGEADLYPDKQQTFVDVPALSEHLCAKFRVGHFRGVATVVLKLFNIVQPDRAYFGEKDAQQLVVIRRMVRDLNVPVAIVAVPTVREADGLALSSRNRLLTPENRAAAPILARALGDTVQRIESGEHAVAVLREQALKALATCPEMRVEYFEIVDPEILAPVDYVRGPVLIAAAAWLGSVRLIDNMKWPA